MFRAAPVPALLTLCLTGSLCLSGCARTTDNFTPRIVVGGSEGGTVAQSAQAAVRGYVLDDTGVQQITVDGKPVQIEGSAKIAHFTFQPQAKTGKAQYTIKATDAAGHTGVLAVNVIVDATPPQLKVTSFTRSRNLIRVAGVATDNNRVAQIMIDGNRLNISPGQKVEFYAETTGIYADLEAFDAAGNKTKVRAQY